MIERYLRYLRSLRRLLTMVPWACENCFTPNETSLLIWPSERFKLICRGCGNAQNYPTYIRHLDPEPIPKERYAVSR